MDSMRNLESKEEFCQLWKPRTIISLLSMKNSLRPFASGRDNFPPANVLDFLLFPSKMFN